MASLALTAVLATACQTTLSGGTTDRDKPGARSVSGRLLTPDGSPAAGVKVYLARRPVVAIALFELLATTLTLGLLCVEPAVSICDVGAETLTDDEGRFEFTSQSGRDERLGVVAQLPAGAGQISGPGVAAEFSLNGPSVVLPGLRLWDPALDLRAVEGGRAQLAWEPLPGAAGGSTRYRAAFFDESSRPVLGLDAGTRSASFDARLLEDARGAVAVSASAVVEGEGLSLRARFSSAGMAYQGGAGPPLSRSRPCGPGPCPLTDGDLTTVAPEGASPGPVDLGETRDIDLVVVRGACVECPLESSTDGAVWRPLSGRALVASSVGSLRAVAVDGRGVRLVRVAPAPSAGAPGTVPAELSVWEGTPLPTPVVVNGPTDAALAGVARGDGGDGAGTDDVGGGWLLAAGLLLGAVAAGVAVVVSRRGAWPGG